MRLAQRSARSIGDSTSTVHPSVAAFREGVPEKKASLTSLESLSGRTTTTCSPVSFRLILVWVSEMPAYSSSLSAGSSPVIIPNSSREMEIFLGSTPNH